MSWGTCCFCSRVSNISRMGFIIMANLKHPTWPKLRSSQMCNNWWTCFGHTLALVQFVVHIVCIYIYIHIYIYIASQKSYSNIYIYIYMCVWMSCNPLIRSISVKQKDTWNLIVPVPCQWNVYPAAERSMGCENWMDRKSFSSRV